MAGALRQPAADDHPVRRRPEVLRAGHRPVRPQGVGAVDACRPTTARPRDLASRDFRPRPRLRVPVDAGRPARRCRRSTPTTTSGRRPFAGPLGRRDGRRAGGRPRRLVDRRHRRPRRRLGRRRCAREVARWAPLGGRVAVFAGLDYADVGRAAGLRRGGGAAPARRRRGRGPRPQGLEAAGADRARRRRAGSSPSTTRAWIPCGPRPASWASRSPSTSPTRSPSSSRSTRRTSASRSSSSTPTGTSGRPGRAGRPDLPGFPPFDEIIDGLEARRRLATRGRRSSGPTWAASRRTSGGSAPCWRRTPTGTWTSPPGSPSWGASRTRPATSSSAGRTGSSSAPTRLPTRPGGRSTPASSRRATSRSPTSRRSPTTNPRLRRRPARRAAGRSTAWGSRRRSSGSSTPANARRLLFRDLPGDAGGHVTLHLLPAARWEAWRADPDPAARYAPAGFDAEGFVHCTDGDGEMLAVANRFYAGEPGSVPRRSTWTSPSSAPRGATTTPGAPTRTSTGRSAATPSAACARSSATPRAASSATDGASFADARPRRRSLARPSAEARLHAVTPRFDAPRRAGL